MADLRAALALTLKHEGGYANDPDDEGGETYMGISRKWNPDSELWPLIDKHKPIKHGYMVGDAAISAEVETVYLNKYWNPIKGNQINSQRVANCIFDFAVNSGGGIKIVQGVLGVTPDGIVGNKTIAAINTMAPDKLIADITVARKEYLQALSLRGNNRKYLNGWLSRAGSFA